ncbi:hypothetical protein UA08_07706 [Talaromyces atroroseus]|uniref:RNase III domain-containing protein n=1 Tax=Talaromyces atroroseus TaxID=1441469 RepID=A0A225AGD6_TALAT|nr:hypothetical protein UA08_07706 [Talaromyces atroroseus]OKL57174.1 hypothetical protein UA08_07706 [Talaromyces atroroseus]
MGSKRYHTEGSFDPNKRVKRNRHDELPMDHGSTLVQQLKDVVDQMVSHPQLLQDYPGGADIAKMATQLHTTLNKRENTPTRSTARLQLHDASLPEPPFIRDPSLVKAVFTHPGAPTNAAAKGQEINYDRLEVLGDAYVEVIATRLIWDQFKDVPPGRMSQIREDLVKNETLAGFATQYGFDGRVSAPEDQRMQPKRWLKIRADVFEAYVAAVVLSNPGDGFGMVEKWLGQLWQPRLSHVQPVQSVLKYKEKLAKKVMGKGIKLRYVEEKPPKQLDGGMQTFYIGVYLTGWGWHDQHLGSGSGLNKASAGDQAAERALHNVPLIDEVAAAKVAYDKQASKRDM